jgi:hypothetical protein
MLKLVEYVNDGLKWVLKFSWKHNENKMCYLLT